MAKGDLDKFLSGEPLTPRLAALKQGIFEDDEEQLADPIVPADPHSRPIDDADRKALAEMLALPGWRVWQRLQEQSLQELVLEATINSQINPLGRERDIAVGWERISLYRQAVESITKTVILEVEKLRGETNG